MVESLYQLPVCLLGINKVAYHLRILDNLFLLRVGEGGWGGGELDSILSGVIYQIRLVYVNITIQIQLRDVTVAVPQGKHRENKV